MPPNKLQIAERAKKYKGEALRNLHQFITVSHSKAGFQHLNKNSIAGLDYMQWYDRPRHTMQVWRTVK